MLAVGSGLFWGVNTIGRLTGLRSAGVMTTEMEIGFIHSRVPLAIVQPRWLTTIAVDADSLEWIWSISEMIGRAIVALLIAILAWWAFETVLNWNTKRTSLPIEK